MAELRASPYVGGVLFYGVTTTGIFCRVGCRSRRPRPENIVRFASASEARAHGFRACLRCRPEDEASATGTAPAAVELACRYIERSPESPTLAKLAARARLSPSYLQRLFKATLGVSPREYASSLRRQRVQRELAAGSSATQALYGAGFGSSSRLYERSGALLGMTPGRFRGRGRGELIRYGVTKTPLGLVLLASTPRGVCALELGNDLGELESVVKARFGEARLERNDRAVKEALRAVRRYVAEPQGSLQLPLDVRATAFQARVWQALQKIAAGKTRSYGELARLFGTPGAARAIARACAQNPVALVVPCHRVVGSDGELRGYRWGIERKRWLLEREAEARPTR